MCSRPARTIAVLVGAFCLAAVVPASAELLFFSETRAMSIERHRFDGDRVIVTLRGGGEMSFDRSLVSKIAPDEAPYDAPDDPSAKGAVDGAAPLALGVTAFDPIIDRASAQHGVPARLVKAVIQVESGFQSGARSPKGAMGLMQLMPTTARTYEAGRNPYDPVRNIQAGTRYLRKLLNEFELPLALAAYNAGEAAVRRFGGIPPYAETQAYVKKIMALVGPTAQIR